MNYKKVYVSSPLSADVESRRQRNILMAKSYEEVIAEYFSCRAVAPHGYIPYILDDSVPEERKLALDFCRQIIKTCDALILCGDTISSGMREEAQFAAQHDIPVFRYQNGCCKKISGSELSILITVEIRR